MTTSTKLSGASLAPRPPTKGSFPLDHLSECKQFAQAYEKCLDKHEHVSQHCRKEARAYLECRMERGLMAKERWDKLGLSKDSISSENAGQDESKRVEEEGFVAGMRTAKRRKNRYADNGDGDVD